MLDQSYNLNCCFFCSVLISDLHLFQDIALLNLCFNSSKNLMLSFIEKVATGIQSLVLFIWNVALVVVVAATFRTRGSANGLPATETVFDILNVIHFLAHHRSSSILQ